MVEVDDTPDYHLFFKKFRMVLDQQALDFWDRVILYEFPHARQHTENNWKEAINMMKKSFAGGSQAQEQIIDYLSTVSCRKPLNVSVEQHVHRILQLINYANQSNGDGPRVDTDFQKNKILLQTFPPKWQRNWKNSGNKLADTSVEELIAYFAQQKVTADEEFHSRRGNKRKPKGGRGTGGYKLGAAAASHRNNQDDTPQPSSSKRTKYGDKYYSPDKKCPIHLHGTHNWGDCKDNKQSCNYVPPRSSNFRGGRGSGGGQGWQPRSAGQSSGQQQQQGNTQASRDHHLHDVHTSTTSTQSMNIDEHAYDMIGSPQSDMTDGGSRTGGSNATAASHNAWPPTRTDHPGYWADGALH